MIEVGEYVITSRGYVFYIDDKTKIDALTFLDVQYGDIKNHSKNLIDLIEVGDYVNGYRVTYVCNKEPCPSGKYVDIDCDRPSEYCTLWEGDVKSIVTHEQFEAMEYKVGGEDE